MKRSGLLKILTACGLLNVALFVINVRQAGERAPDGRSMEEILGVDPAKATYADVEKLSRADTMQLFFAAPAPEFGSMQGEYRAKVLSGGVLGPATAFFTHHVFPTGLMDLQAQWEGKAFTAQGENAGWGYNIFSRKGCGGEQALLRTRKMRTYVGPTTIGKDGKDSFHLDYAPENRHVIIHTMHDEIRQVNENLYICAGYMAPSGGPLNPGPFVLMGPPTAWLGV